MIFYFTKKKKKKTDICPMSVQIVDKIPKRSFVIGILSSGCQPLILFFFQ